MTRMLPVVAKTASSYLLDWAVLGRARNTEATRSGPVVLGYHRDEPGRLCDVLLGRPSNLALGAGLD